MDKLNDDDDDDDVERIINAVVTVAVT